MAYNQQTTTCITTTDNQPATAGANTEHSTTYYLRQQHPALPHTVAFGGIVYHLGQQHAAKAHTTAHSSTRHST